MIPMDFHQAEIRVVPSYRRRKGRELIGSRYAGRKGTIEVRPAIHGAYASAFVMPNGYRAGKTDEVVTIPVDISSATLI
jgi:hypothetical protein